MGFDSISERFRSLSTHPGSLYETTKIESDPIFPCYASSSPIVAALAASLFGSRIPRAARNIGWTWK